MNPIQERSLPTRRVAVVHHDGDEDHIEETRRPLYRHLIMEELVGGPSAIRFRSDGTMDLLVPTHSHFEGDAVAQVEDLPAGRYATAMWEGPVQKLPDARRAFLEDVRRQGHEVQGPLLQVHHMDPVDGDLEEEFQVLLERAA